MLSCLIIDDEEHGIAVLKKFIMDTPGLELAGSTTDPVEGVRMVDELAPDITFLDMEMNKLSGLDTARLIVGKTRIIFATGHLSYAYQSYSVEAVDYLLKPFNYSQFLQAIRKAEKTLAAKPIESGDDYIFILVEGRTKRIRIALRDIYYISAEANYVNIYLETQKYLIYITLKDMEEKIRSPQFLRVHRSYIVNLQKIIAVDGNTLVLANNAQVAIGASYKGIVTDLIDRKTINLKDKQ